MGEKIDKIKEGAKKNKVPLSLFGLLSTGIVYGCNLLTTLSNNHHAEEMKRIDLDSARMSRYEVFNNNKLDEQECEDKRQDSLIKNKTNCKN